jgi:hypothetical protein
MVYTSKMIACQEVWTKLPQIALTLPAQELKMGTFVWLIALRCSVAQDKQ